MLYHRRADTGCSFWCCRELDKRGGRNWHRTLRSREKRAWRSEVWA
jgi:hypothetical protein